jgi:uncharacterized protein
MCLPLPRWSCRQPTSGGVLVVTGVGLLLINVILGPVTEKLYLRGYLLPRLYRFGIWAPLINISLFSLYHYLTPWDVLSWIVMLLPKGYAVGLNGTGFPDELPANPPPGIGLRAKD